MTTTRCFTEAAAPGRSRTMLAACGSVLALALLIAAPAGAAEPRSLRPELGVHSLPNGLTIYTLEDHSAPLVTYEVWFKVGSSYERQGTGGGHGITGLSHFFEHMMFRGTKKHPKFFDDIYAMGGKLNAWTWMDSTVYWEKLPSRYLGTTIAMEADRLANMEMSFLALEPEREVVKSERLLRTENSADGAMSELLDKTAFRAHPYHWPTVGWMDDLNAITLEEASTYYKQHYAPNNAFVVIVGDFDTKEAIASVKAAYGSLPRTDVPSHPRPAEPDQVAERRDFIEKPVDNDRMTIGWRIPGLAARDFMVLEVIDQILTGGKSSRLQKELVYAADPSVQSLSAALMPVRDPYHYLWNVTMMPGHGNNEADEAIVRAMQRLATEPVGADEMEKAVNRLRAQAINGMLTTQQRADLIGFGVLTGDDPYLFFDRLELYDEVKPADIQRVAAQLLTPKTRVLVTAVDPRRMLTILDAVVKVAPASAPALDEALRKATELTLQDAEVALAVEQVEREEQAITLLGERAKLARKDAEGRGATDEVAAIDEYVQKSEKGTVVRGERAKVQREATAKTKADLEAAWAALQKEAAPLAKARNDDAPRDAHRRAALSALLGRGKGRWVDPKDAADVDPLDHALAAVQKGAWLDRMGRIEEGAKLREDALGWVRNTLRKAEGDQATALKEAYEWLYDTRRTGIFDVAARGGAR